MKDFNLYNEDCMKILKGMDDESVDLVVTDCPYHIVAGGCTNDHVKIGRYTEPSGILRRRYGKGASDDAVANTRKGKIFEHNDIEFSDWLPQIYRVLKPNTHCYIMINPRNLKDLQTESEKVGFIFQNILIWDKGNATPNRYYMNAYEIVLMLRKGSARNINNMGTYNIIRVKNIIRTKQHPTEKPAELMQIMIENSSNENDVVLDPFMGVGGVGVACKSSNRKFIGIEIDEKYFRIADERINGKGNKTGEPVQMSIFDFL